MVLAPVIVDGLVVAIVVFGMCGDRPLWDDDELEVSDGLCTEAQAELKE